MLRPVEPVGVAAAEVARFEVGASLYEQLHDIVAPFACRTHQRRAPFVVRVRSDPDPRSSSSLTASRLSLGERS